MARTGVALIGLGMVSDLYVEALRELQARVALCGVLGRDVGKAQQFLDRHGLAAHAYCDLQALLTDRQVAFVLLTTPPDARAEFVTPLAAAGKHILSEKPLERDLAAATAICESCEAAGVTLGVMLQHRARPAAQALAERRGDLGALQLAEISVPWWRDQSYYDVAGRGTYARDGGGVMITQAIHTLDLALQFTGPVAEVCAMLATTDAHKMEAEDMVSAGLRFANGAPGHVFATTAAFPGRAEAITLHFSRGSARLVGNHLRIDWRAGSFEEIGAEAATGAGADPMAFSAAWHRDMIADFAEALDAGRAPPLASGRSALAVHALIGAIEASARSGERVLI